MFRTSVSPDGKFLVALHRPSYSIVNLREYDWISVLGHTKDGNPCDNRVNFPEGDIRVPAAKRIYEIPNAFPFRGTTYIDPEWAEKRAADPASIGMSPPHECSLGTVLKKHLNGDQLKAVMRDLPPQLLYGLAANSTDPEELVQLANGCCRLELNDAGEPCGLRYVHEKNGKLRPDIDDNELFETIANNPFLPDSYKEIMVLRPGVQGESKIVGEWNSENSHVFEYLRSNSYIPWGHFAPNMANDSIRYRAANLSPEDMQGLRHLYYQRVYVALAEKVGIAVPVRRKTITVEQLEEMRQNILLAVNNRTEHLATLWGWNFGYDFSSSGYRLHASHQMIHQQYALVPETVTTADGTVTIPAYSCGDLVADVVDQYRKLTGSDFFNDFFRALRNNNRTDQKAGEQSLVVWEDENVVLFVPKAQVSQWELQLLVKTDSPMGPVGNVLEADISARQSIDRGILLAQHIYAGLNAKMVTSIEFSKRVGVQNGQRLLYSFLPKLPWSMGAFSEAQLRFICGHYPEDFAACCHLQMKTLTDIKNKS
ncbi:MAG: hypothetical protein OEM01_04195 [Desulfobulbaceae bacterium]|nr:hypothetical protein [Desulfobulbaceae bacterium]